MIKGYHAKKDTIIALVVDNTERAVVRGRFSHDWTELCVEFYPDHAEFIIKIRDKSFC